MWFCFWIFLCISWVIISPLYTVMWYHHIWWKKILPPDTKRCIKIVDVDISYHVDIQSENMLPCFSMNSYSYPFIKNSPLEYFSKTTTLLFLLKAVRAPCKNNYSEVFIACEMPWAEFSNSRNGGHISSNRILPISWVHPFINFITHLSFNIGT